MIQGEHIFLRAVEIDDLHLIYSWENDTANWKASQSLVSYSRESLKRLIEEGVDIMAYKQVRYMIGRHSDEKTLGSVDLFECDFINRRAGVGVLIGPEEERGKGYAAEALALLEYYAIKSLGLQQLWCHIAADNARSVKLFTDAGYERSGTLRNWIYTPESFVDQFIFQKILD